MTSFMSFKNLFIFVFVLMGVGVSQAWGSQPPTASPASTTSVDPACAKGYQGAVGKGDGVGSDSCDFQGTDAWKTINNDYGKFGMAMAMMAPQAACSGLSDIAMNANGALAAFDLVCKQAISDCINSCNAAVKSTDPTVVTDAQKKVTACKNLGERVKVNTGALVMSLLNTNKIAASCNTYQQMTSNMGGSSAISGDCTNPVNATNPVCAGLHAATISPSGASLASAGVRAAGGVGGGAAISGVGGGLGGFGPPSDLGSALSKPGDKNAAALAIAPGGNGGGAGLGAGGGLGGAKKKTGPAGAAEPRDTKMYGGFIGGGGSVSGSSGSSSEGSTGKRAVFGSQFANQEKPGGPDLSKFAPNMKYDPSRNLAGVTGPDGITGPNSNLFNKVNNQFNAQTMQDRMFAPNP